jgi:hypothetical protein
MALGHMNFSSCLDSDRNAAKKHGLPESSPIPTLRFMRELARRFLLLLCALAFFGGTTVGLVMHPAAAGEPCAEHQGGAGTADHHDGKHGGNCLTCCVGACVALPDLPPRPLSSLIPLTATTVAYWEGGNTISGRSIAPDTAPPRLST